MSDRNISDIDKDISKSRLRVLEFKKDDTEKVDEESNIYKSEILGMLDGIREEVEAGEYGAVAVSLVSMDGSYTANAFVGRYPVQLIGELSVLQREIIDHHITTRLHEAGEPY